jgi:hypothetical protein
MQFVELERGNMVDDLLGRNVAGPTVPMRSASPKAADPLLAQPHLPRRATNTTSTPSLAMCVWTSHGIPSRRRRDNRRQRLAAPCTWPHFPPRVRMGAVVVDL